MARHFMFVMIAAVIMGCNPSSKTSEITDTSKPTETWLDRLGVQSTAEITSLATVRELIDLSGTNIKDADLSHLQHFDRIDRLNISSTALTDSAVELLRKLPSVRELDIVFSRITGAGIGRLSAHPNLETIHVWHDQLDDNGLAGFKGMINLKQVVLWIPEYNNLDKILPPKIKSQRPDVDVRVMWYVPKSDH